MGDGPVLLYRDGSNMVLLRKGLNFYNFEVVQPLVAEVSIVVDSV